MLHDLARSWHEPEGLEGPEGFQPEDEGKLGEAQ